MGWKDRTVGTAHSPPTDSLSEVGSAWLRPPTRWSCLPLAGCSQITPTAARVIGPAKEETSKVQTQTESIPRCCWWLEQWMLTADGFLIHQMTPLLRDVGLSKRAGALGLLQPSQDVKKGDQPMKDNGPPQAKELSADH
ncbi:hypothetical protein CHARACLAT_025301 [Characodon lateralis]|uniref:Uncharacterized protein n=1 Tax=Characodon lateralis TaxID=208331 RepID=A0ABU7F5Z0_9TELE|nr:hypothetical protein [Characodon lateralis]